MIAPPEHAIAEYKAQVAEWGRQYGDFATCPITGLEIPKGVAANIKWRKALRDKARESEQFRKIQKQACASSFIYWVNAFAFTFHQKWVNKDGEEVAVVGDDSHVPFITWRIQDESALKIIECIEKGTDVLIDKSRDMGASWIVVAIFQWLWQFRHSVTLLEMSRKEVYVDQWGNMDSLFEKHRYLLRMQPLWLRPRRVRDTALMLENQDMGSSIVGESTNEHAGQGGRKTAILLDEFARVRQGEEIDLATADTSACRIFNSTVNGPATHYTRIYREMRMGRRAGVIIELPWEAHPAKGRDVEIIEVPVTPRHPLGLKAISPWYRREESKRSARNVAQNIDRDHGKSGDMFFDPAEIEQHRGAFQSEPLVTGSLRFDEDLTEDERRGVVLRGDLSQLRLIESGIRLPWRFWAPFVNGRPIQTHAYVFGVDISMGSGASNSIITVFDDTANMKIGEFADAFTTPEDLAWQVAMAGVWVGGLTGRPLLIWETNGPGSIFGKKIVHIGYAPIYFTEIEGTSDHKTTSRYGWNSTATRKEILLGMYRDATKAGRYINPCKESLDEALDYTYNERGTLEPATERREGGGGANATHGDRVIADALCELGRTKLPSFKSVPPIAPRGSYAELRDKHLRSMRREREAWLR